MARYEWNESSRDTTETTRWAIAALTSSGAGAFLGGSLTEFDLVNLLTNRAHRLTLTSGGFTLGPLPVSASLSSSNYAYFTTPRPVTFRDFDGKLAGLRSLSAGFYSYAELFIKDGFFSLDLVNTAIDGGWGIGTPGMDAGFGYTILLFGAGTPAGEVNLVPANPDVPIPEPAVLKATEVSKLKVEFELSGDALFGFDNAEIKGKAAVALEYAGTVIRSRRGRVEIIGYTDSIGSDDYNQKLSERRAAAVRTWLINGKFVKDANVKAWGNGSQSPVVNNSDRQNTAANRDRQQPNRRVEVVIDRR